MSVAQILLTVPPWITVLVTLGERWRGRRRSPARIACDEARRARKRCRPRPYRPCPST
jgi:hypothetical protein